ncbi:MAG: hypothetical protein O3A36_03435 [bacterium]|nr:hypothetical protein [bacterium]
MNHKKAQAKLHWYAYTTILSFVLVFIAITAFPTQEILLDLGLAGPIGALFAGMLFVSSFTAIIGTFFIAALAEAMPLWQLVLIGGLGASLIDVLLFHLVRHTVFEEMKPLMYKWRRRHFMRVLHSKYISWTVPLLGALIIISPLPDEIGVSMLGISNLNTRKFAVLSFALNCFGVFLVAVTARAIS